MRSVSAAIGSFLFFMSLSKAMVPSGNFRSSSFKDADNSDFQSRGSPRSSVSPGQRVPIFEAGYDCDNLFFPLSKLEPKADNLKSVHKKLLLNFMRWSLPYEYYKGPPFAERYLLLPISPKIINHNKQDDGGTKYRLVLDKEFQIFSLITRTKEGVKECLWREKKKSRHFPSDYRCDREYISYSKIVRTAKEACPKIKGFASPGFPVRFNRPKKARSEDEDDSESRRSENRQLYLYPVIFDGVYDNSKDPGPYRIVINSACKVQEALWRDSEGQFKSCGIIGSSFIPNDDD